MTILLIGLTIFLPTYFQMASTSTNYFKIIKSALRGDEFDFTTLNMKKAIVLLSIPMMLELILESVFALVDIYFVNKLGVHAVSAVGLTESVITILYSIGIGLSAAATAIVARRIGEKNTDEASHAGAQAIILGIFTSLIIGFLGIYFSETILKLMGAKPEAIKIGLRYCQIMLGGNVAIILLFLINGIFRGAGNASIAMKSLWIGNIFNILIDPLLIFGIGFFPEFGVTGAAIATTTGRCIGVIYQIYHLRKSSSYLKIERRHFIPDLSILKKIIGLAAPATFQFIIASASWIFLASMVASYGSEASAGYQTAIRLVIFFILPAWGMSNAVATLVGQNLGAKSADRAEESVKLGAKYNAIFMGFVSLFFIFYAEFLLKFFIPTDQIGQLSYATLALQIISSGYIFYGIGMVLNQAFNGAGDTKTPTWIYFFGFWLFQIPFAYFLHRFTDLKANGIFLAVPVAETLMAIAAFILFKKGRWKLTNL